MSQPIVDYLYAQKFKPDDRIPSERKLAEALGRSRGQINREVIRLIGEGQLRREGRRLFLQKIPKGPGSPPIHYVHNFPNSIEFIEPVAQAHQSEVIEVKCEGPNGYQKAYDDILRNGSNGLLIHSPTNQSLLDAIQRKGIPVVAINSSWANGPCVRRDLANCSQQAVRLLAEYGHTQIALFTREETTAHYIQSGVIEGLPKHMQTVSPGRFCRKRVHLY